MNKAQLTNMLVTFIVGGTATFVTTKFGISMSDWQKDVSDLVACGIAVATYFIAHRYHGNNPPTTNSAGTRLGCWAALLMLTSFGALATQAQSLDLQTSLQGVWDNTMGSSNTVYAPFFARKMTGNADEAGVLAFYNFNSSVSAGAGILHEWQPSGGQAASTFSVSVNLQLKQRVYYAKMFGNTNLYCNVFGITGVGTPFSGNNSGGLATFNRAGIDFPLHEWKVGVHDRIDLSIGGFYGNETGTGYYSGNWAGGFGTAGWSSDDGSVPSPVGMSDDFDSSGGLVATKVTWSF